MEGELYNFIEVWSLVFVSLSYCYGIGKIIPQGKTRFFLLLPIICLFLVLPLNLSSMHLGGMTAFFIAWLANFKILLFAFGKAPLSCNPSTSFIQFLPLACLPIKIQPNPNEKSHLVHGRNKENRPLKSHLNGQSKENPSQKSHLNDQNKENPSQNGQNNEKPVPKKCQKSISNYAIKFILLAVMIRVYDYSEFIHPKVILVLYCFHIYFFLELILAMVAALARALLNLELEPQFNEPYLSTSLQDFWGRRWNIMVTSILRPTVYEPVLKTCTPIIGRKWAPLPAVMGTFVVSAVMHELIFYYLGRLKPTWEITSFFLLHGVCLTIEMALKKAVNGSWRLPVWISGPLAAGFVLVTGFWLFFPPLLRCKADVRAFEEYAAVSTFLKNSGRYFCLNLSTHQAAGKSLNLCHWTILI